MHLAGDLILLFFLPLRNTGSRKCKGGHLHLWSESVALEVKHFDITGGEKSGIAQICAAGKNKYKTEHERGRWADSVGVGQKKHFQAVLYAF